MLNGYIPKRIAIVTNWSCCIMRSNVEDKLLVLHFDFVIHFLYRISQYSGLRNEPPHDKTNKVACAPSEDSDQPGHPPSLIRVFAVHMKKAWILSYPLSTQQKLWSDWVDAQADLSHHWAHMPFSRFCHVATHINYFFRYLV